ncbi:MAG: spore coat U domain-containing protein [Alcanivorax sp.]|nr:spore coat U domain-containing protein [Alcanivorax sp.]
MKKLLQMTAMASACLIGNAALAATVSDTFEVRITLESACEISGTVAGGSLGASDLNFGTHPGLLDANIDADNGSDGIAVRCSNGTSYSIGLDEGSNVDDGPVAGRAMENDGNFVSYELFQDGARNSRWGALNSGEEVNAVGTGARQVFSVFGRVPPQSLNAVDLSAGTTTFTDTITATVEF